MGPSYNVLIHEIFKQQILLFVKSQPKSSQAAIEKQIITALNKLKCDPTGPANGNLHENRDPKFIGKIRKIYVGGNERYRLINLCLPEKKIVLPIYMSEVRRGDFDYGKIPWDSAANEIHADFVNGATNNFSKL